MTAPEPEPTSAERGWTERVWSQLTVGLLDRVPREQRDTDAGFRRRRVVSAVTLLVGAVGLALSLRMDRDSPWFTLAALAVAAVWFAGALASGRLHAGRISVSGKLGDVKAGFKGTSIFSDPGESPAEGGTCKWKYRRVDATAPNLQIFCNDMMVGLPRVAP